MAPFAGRGRWVAAILALLQLVLLSRAPAPARAQDNTVGAKGPSTLVYPPYRHTYGIHKARTPHLKLFLGGRTVFSNPQGLAAVKLARDDDPSIKGDDFQLTLFGLNAGRGEIIYNSSMQTLAMYGTHGAGEAQFDDPHGIAADVDGNVYVADTGNRRVVHLTWRWPERQLDWAGLLPGSYREPWGVATAPPGHDVYVSDREADQVYRWARPDSTGAKTGAPTPVFAGGISHPTALAVVDSRETWVSAREDALYVVYEDGTRLGKFAPSGELLASTSSAERRPIRTAPRFAYVAVDFYGNVYATDTANGTIYKYKGDLTFLTSYGTPGEGEHQLNEPRGIAIWKRFGQVFVAEKEGAQYFFVGTDVDVPENRLPVRVSGEGARRRYAFEAFFTEPTLLSLAFLSDSGAVVDSLAIAEALDSGSDTVQVAAGDLAPDLPERASRIVLEPKPTYSSKKRFSRRIEREIDWQMTP